MCLKWVQITNPANGKSQYGHVRDECQGCGQNDLGVLYTADVSDAEVDLEAGRSESFTIPESRREFVRWTLRDRMALHASGLVAMSSVQYLPELVLMSLCPIASRLSTLQRSASCSNARAAALCNRCILLSH